MTWLIAGFGGLGQEMAQVMRHFPDLKQTPIVALRRHPPRDAATEEATETPTEKPTPNTQWFSADLTDPSTLNLPSGLSHVVYCATPDQRDEANYHLTYEVGLQNLVHALHQTGNHNARLLFVSSTAVYGANQAGWLDETSPTEPSGFNGRVLLRAEQWLLAHWPNALVLRLSGLYGPKRRALLTRLAQGQASVPPSEDYWANRIHIHDAARAVIHLLRQTKCHGIYIGTDSTPVPLRTLYRDLAQALGAPEPQPGPPSPMMGKKRLSNQKLINSGFELEWPDCRRGYAAMIANPPISQSAITDGNDV